MAIPRKGTRRIIVDGNEFIWKIKKYPSHNERHNVDYLIPVQHVNNGQILKLSIGYNRSGYSFNRILAVIPSIISKCIKLGISKGWKYEDKLPPLEIDCSSVIHEEAALLTKKVIEGVRYSTNKREICIKIATDALELCNVGEFEIALENIVSNISEYDIPLEKSVISFAIQAFTIWQNEEYTHITKSMKII